MLKSHVKFHASNGKRLILVADDESVNRELLGMLLSEDYEVIYAEDGQETEDKIRQYKDDLSLVLLDIMMPVKSGFDVLRDIKDDPELKHIPVIVLTSDQDAEIESLSIGAIDYIPKPYPQAGIINARILRAIELSEDREIILNTERDPLTGLYNREYFYRYAEQYDLHHKNKPMDAIVVDINHFNMINERFGREYGDEVLRTIGEKLREAVSDVEGIVCRREADTFMVYCPHGKDYKEILESAFVGLAGDSSVINSVRLRLGVYAEVDKTMEIERRFDRAQMAADMVKGSFTGTIGIYDNDLHERELYAEQLIDGFEKAIEEKQFKVHFQPKFDVRPKVPVLASAEALVRWQHPELGMISPGLFIPLFEENGLIRKLDGYVWRETALQVRDWKDRLGFSVPVSVNVSRIDMYDPDLLSGFERILAESGLKTEDFYLEITESAYTQDSEQIIKTVNDLRSMGFKIEMDDFGTWYSSLNMISSLPVDALKLDMQFVRSAFREQKDTRMLEVIIDIADHLSVPVIAEGVETEEQMKALKDLGCDIVQGYYFSKPVPPEEMEEFILVRKNVKKKDMLPEVPVDIPQKDTDALPGSDKAEAESKAEGKTPDRAFSLRKFNSAFAIVAFLVTAGLIVTEILIRQGSGNLIPGQIVLTTVMMLAVLADVVFVTTRVRIPLTRLVKMMKEQKKADPVGAEELIYVTQTYNEFLEANQKAHIQLSYDASHDTLTGLLNRSAYDMFMDNVDKDHIALVIVDVDEFKTINDTYGHDIGDSILKHVAKILKQSFRSVDAVCRIGGDEFVVVMTRANSSMSGLVVNKINYANEILSKPVDGMPAVSLSAGVAFSDRKDPQGDIFKDADKALYRMKKAGRGGCVVYGSWEE